MLTPEAAADRKGRDLLVGRFAAMFDAMPSRSLAEEGRR